jgi:hypothetical protein
MQSSETFATVTPTLIHQEFCQSADRLQTLIREDSEEFGDLQHLHDLLESLPLTSDEYGRASNHLRNANRYLASGERGAAQFELRMLFGSLRHSEPLTIEPRARSRCR